MFMDYNSFSLMDKIFPFIFLIMFIVVIGFIVFAIINAASEAHKNNNSPRITVDATVVGKRTSVTHHGSNTMHTNISTSYYVTFQFESGDRGEYHVTSSEYGMLAEGDFGRLTFQGTRYLDFERSY